MKKIDIEPNKTKKKKKNKLARVFLVIFLLFLAAGIGGMFFLHSKLNRINKIDRTDVAMLPREEETFETDDGLIREGTEVGEDEAAKAIVWDHVDMDIMRDENVKNILLIGQDRREGQGRQRSDTMIICSINKNNGKIILTSVMRDMYVPIPGYSDNRINAAYQFGGMPLLDQVLEESLGIHIDGNVEVDFDGFISAMTHVGNVQIELYEAEAKYLNSGHKDWNLTAGVNSLTPEQALSYARLRSVGNSDWERTDRQRRVIMAALDNVKKLGFMELVELADKVLPYLTTDMTNNEILGYIYTVVANGITTIESHRLPVDGTYTNQSIRGMSVLVPELSANSRYLKQYIYGN